MPKAINLLVSITATLFLNAISKNIGRCPYLQSPSWTFVRSCVSDNDCPGSQKCCYTSVGQECVPAVHDPFGPVVKLGHCPLLDGPRIPGAWFDACAFDANCPGALKCCVLKFGTRCVDPIFPILPVVTDVEVEPFIDEPILVEEFGEGNGETIVLINDLEKKHPSKDAPKGSSLDDVVVVVEGELFPEEPAILEETGSAIEVLPVVEELPEVTVVDVIEENGVTMETAVDNLILSSNGFIHFWDHPGECPPQAALVHGPSRRCLIDFQCIEGYKCCDTVHGRGCVKALQQDLSPLPKAGFCPSPAGPRIQGKWSDRCYSDWNCVLDLKCCVTPWGTRCTEPSGDRSPFNNFNFLTPGLCPEVQPASFGTRVDFCFQDTDCAAGWKCCMGRFGLECKVPLRGN
uniref:WAP domain-containing protein n=1 Tax=Trichuris muris TaxID=70415 RepID=A0A5S6R2H3_TRIMR